MANGRASVSGEGRALSRATRHKSSERYPPRPSAVQSMLRAGQGGRGPMQARARAREGEPERVPAIARASERETQRLPNWNSADPPDGSVP
jgi:hypothetical protein